MEKTKPMNQYILVKMLDKKKTDGVFLGEQKNAPKEAELLAFSENCENKNFEVGKTVQLNKYEYIAVDEENDIYYVNEKAVMGMY